MATFDAQAAKAAGYTDEEIAKVTSGIDAAKQAGYSDAEIQQYLANGLNGGSERRSTSIQGLGSEMGKGAVRGAVGAADTASLASKYFPPTALAGLAAKTLAPDLTRRAEETVADFRARLLEQNQAAKNASVPEQMLGTGTELATQGALTGGVGGGPAATAMNTLVPAVGGAIGEQAFGEQGKAVGALAAPFVASRVGAALRPAISDDLRMLVDAGAETTLGQNAGGVLKRLETLPILREFTSSARENAGKTFVVAANNLALRPLQMGNKPLGNLDVKNMTGNEIFAKADGIAQDAYNALLPKLNIKIDPQLPQDLAAVKATYANDPDLVNKLDNIQKTVFKLMSKPGTTSITGADMKTVDTRLGEFGRAELRKGGAEGNMAAEAIYDMQRALRDMVTRQNPAQAPELAKINGAWNNLKRIENATLRAQDADGYFTPQQLSRAVTAVSPSKKLAATGEAAMQDVAQAGIRNMNPREGGSIPYSALNQAARAAIPVSGAAGAAGAGYALGGTLGSAVLPVAATGALYAGAYTPTMQGVLRSFLTGNRPAAMGTLGDLLRETRTNPAFVTGLPQFQSLQGE